jgi:hypothetical protein
MRLLGASEFLCRVVQFVILEQSSIPFSSGEVMNPIPQTPEDLAFGREDLRAGCQEGIYERGLICVAKDETSVDIMCRWFCCNFLRKSRL